MKEHLYGDNNNLPFFRSCLRKGFAIIQDPRINATNFISEFNDLATNKELFIESHHSKKERGILLKTAWVDTGRYYYSQRTAEKLMSKPTIENYFKIMAQAFPGGRISGQWAVHHHFDYDELPKGARSDDRKKEVEEEED
jgi:hypothetical protein